jgi:hypothetical protein
MPLQNRVTPFGDLIADAARGTFMGNRGGRIHDGACRLTGRRWASQQWICCRLDFKGRRRRVWGDSYTELFFLDEVTALAAGHRPCFECRRADACEFAAAWERAFGQIARAAEMDAVLHAQRLDGRSKRRHRYPAHDLPDGVMVAYDDAACAIRGDAKLRWSSLGYVTRDLRQRYADIEVLTPPAIVSVLAAGYRPHWHESAASI